MCEGKLTSPSEDAMFLRKEIIDALKRSDEKLKVSQGKPTRGWKITQRKTDEKMDRFLQAITESVGTQLHGMKTTIMKMKEEIQANQLKNHEHGAVLKGFHSETSESEVIQLLKETITEIGMTIENARIECTRKADHACIQLLQERR